MDSYVLTGPLPCSPSTEEYLVPKDPRILRNKFVTYLPCTLSKMKEPIIPDPTVFFPPDIAIRWDHVETNVISRAETNHSDIVKQFFKSSSSRS